MSFGYSTLEEVIAACEQQGHPIRFSRDLTVLGAPCAVGPLTAPNRFCVHPMEGSDANADGSPSPLTLKRYERFADGGSGLIWFEAVSVLSEARASAAQLMITEQNLSAFTALANTIKERAFAQNGIEPVLIMQLTHSGRFSKPTGKPQPLIAYHSEDIDARHAIDASLPTVTDEYLNELPVRFAATAALAERAGFDGVDVKCCHRYLLSELLSAFKRPGRYGGSFENRTRLFLECVDAVCAVVSSKTVVGTRLNGFDALPGGFACDKDDYMRPDLTETLRLVSKLKQRGLAVFNITTGSPYYNSYVNRPNDVEKNEPPLQGVSRMFGVVAEIQKELGDIPVAGTGFSYLREFAPYAAAGEILAENCAFAGFGRMSFACPDFPREVLAGRVPPAGSLCTTCGACAKLLRAGGPSYCAVHEKHE